MPGQPRDSYDMVVRKLAELERELEREKRHKHPTGRNEPAVEPGAVSTLTAHTQTTVAATDDAYADFDDPGIPGVISFNSTDITYVDDGGGTNVFRWTTGGVFLITCHVQWTGASTISDFYGVNLTFTDPGTDVYSQHQGNTGTIGATNPFVLTLELNAGCDLYVLLYNESAGGETPQTWFGITRLV